MKYQLLAACSKPIKWDSKQNLTFMRNHTRRLPLLQKIHFDIGMSRLIADAALFSIVLVFNIGGNSYVVYTITGERGTPTNYLLLNLAVADLLFGVFLAPQFIFLPFFLDSVPYGVLGDWLCKLVLSSNISWIACNVCSLTILTLSVERYFAVCHPYTFRQQFSLQNVKILIYISWIYSFSVTLFLFIGAKRNDDSNNGLVVCKFDNFTSELHSILAATKSCLSVSVMIFSLFKICISLWYKQQVEPTGQREITDRKRKKKVTFSVLAVVIRYLLLWFPSYVLYLLFVFLTDLRKTVDKFDISVLLLSVNAALDPYLYRFPSFKSFFQNINCYSFRSRGFWNTSETQDHDNNVTNIHHENRGK